MPALSFHDARAVVLREISAADFRPPVESVSLGDCSGRVLAGDILADRDYPPFNRSMRDGFAVRAADISGALKVVGEVRAGQTFSGVVGRGEAVEIMTGAPVPPDADAVVMVEHWATDRTVRSGENVAPRGSEAASGSVVLTAGTRLNYISVSCLASVGRTSVAVFVKPRVAILSTGDEIIDVGDAPADDQIRNSNAWSLAAQVERAGGIPVVLPIARDTQEHTRELIGKGLDYDLLLLSGGVSAGNYDVVEPVLAGLGAEFFFDRVLMQPGAPLVFGRVREKFFFGLPGNPASTMVTFEVFARAAIDLLSGVTDTELPLSLARLTQPFRHRAGLTRFLPAELRGSFSTPEVTPVAWKGSGDIQSLCRANVYLVADPDKAEYAAGETISILMQ